MLKAVQSTLSLFTFLLLVASCQVKSAQSVTVASKTDPTASPSEARSTEGREPLKLPLRAPKIVVKKAQRQLQLFSGDKLVRTYRIGLGLNPVGDKVRAGDRRTPEGEFYIFTKNDKSAFYLSLGLSYPNAAHAERGLRDGLITRAQYDAIMRALRAKKAPPRNTHLGGDIYIHGNGAQSDWTWGCVALEMKTSANCSKLSRSALPSRSSPKFGGSVLSTTILSLECAVLAFRLGWRISPAQRKLLERTAADVMDAMTIELIGQSTTNLGIVRIEMDRKEVASGVIPFYADTRDPLLFK